MVRVCSSAWGVMLAGVTCAGWGQGLPASAPTAAGGQGAAAMQTQPIAATQPGAQAARRARVEVAGGKVTVKAENSSLNQILGEVAAAGGVKISGGVAEERVYGTYGPADPVAVLLALLDGTKSNVVLVEAGPHKELVLTPRQGGVTPPSPAEIAARNRDNVEQPQARPLELPQLQGQPGPGPGQPLNGVQGGGVPPGQLPAAPASADGTPGEQPKTPQQIYDQLMRLQQQQQKKPE